MKCLTWAPTTRSPSDYPDFAEAVGRALMAGRAERGILICGSGVGVCVAANKMPGFAPCMCHDTTPPTRAWSTTT